VTAQHLLHLSSATALPAEPAATAVSAATAVAAAAVASPCVFHYAAPAGLVGVGAGASIDPMGLLPSQ
jgi:hypothetical protein